MSNAVIPNVVELDTANAWRNVVFPYEMRLYKNNVTPGETTVLADFTQADYTGYAAQNAVFPVFTTDVNGKASSGPLIFDFLGPTSGAAQDVYGWYLVSTGTGTKLVAAARFTGAPKNLATTADHAKFDVTLRFFDRHQPSEP